MTLQLAWCLTARGNPKSVGDVLFSWNSLPSLPDEEGFAGMYSGTSHGVLIAAGGTKFEGGPWWEGGKKIWSDKIFVFNPADASWHESPQKLPRALAYGVSVAHQDRVICIGGSSNSEIVSEAFALEWDGTAIAITPLPSLPQPLARMAAAQIGNTLYLAGGISRSGGPSQKIFLSLNLDSLTWKNEKPWPGPARHLAVAAAQSGAFFLVSGMQVVEKEDGTTERMVPYLNDAYRFTPRKGGQPGTWTRIADIPRPVAAAPSPAISLGQSHFAILGGVDGSNKDMPKTEVPPFPGQIQLYHTITNTWTERGSLPEGFSRVTQSVTPWEQGYALISGESGPSKRSPDVLVATPVEPEASFGLINWAVVLVYLGGMIGMGFYFSRREKTTDDFFLAGRRIPWWAAGLSIFGTQLSAQSFMAISAVSYAQDWTRWLKFSGTILAAPLVIYFYLPFYRHLNVTSAYEYLEKRFSVAVRLYGTIKFICTQLLRVGVLLYLPSIALAAVTGIDTYTCIVLTTVFCTIYTVLGGMEAVIWSDVIQVIVLMAGGILCLFIVVGEVGGFGEIITVGIQDHKFNIFDWRWDPTSMVVWVLIVGPLFINLGTYSTDQTLVQRYLTTKDESSAARSIWTNAMLSIPVSFLFFPLGTALYAFYRSNPESLSPGKNDAILPWFIVQQLPAGIAGLVIAGIFAATMSSLDSSMNSVSAASVTDFYRRFNKHVTEERALALARWLTIFVGAFGMATAFLLASADIKFIIDSMILLMGLMGGGLTGVFALGVFTRRASSWGVLAGAAAGFIVPLWVHFNTDINFFLYAAIGVITCAAVGYTTSLVFPDKNKNLDGLTLYTLKNGFPLLKKKDKTSTDT